MKDNPMRPKINSMRPDMMRADQENAEAIEEAVERLKAQGLIYDTGQRRWSERTQSYQIVWAPFPAKKTQS